MTEKSLETILKDLETLFNNSSIDKRIVNGIVEHFIPFEKIEEQNTDSEKPYVYVPSDDLSRNIYKVLYLTSNMEKISIEDLNKYGLFRARQIVEKQGFIRAAGFIDNGNNIQTYEITKEGREFKDKIEKRYNNTAD